MWEGAAYGLAGQVIDGPIDLHLKTLRRLQLGEKTWSKLARHFTSLLSQRNIEQVYNVLCKRGGGAYYLMNYS